MIVIVKDANKTIIYRFKHKFIKYYLCVIINKLKGREVKTLKNEGI